MQKAVHADARIDMAGGRANYIYRKRLQECVRIITSSCKHPSPDGEATLGLGIDFRNSQQRFESDIQTKLVFYRLPQKQSSKHGDLDEGIFIHFPQHFIAGISEKVTYFHIISVDYRRQEVRSDFASELYLPQ